MSKKQDTHSDMGKSKTRKKGHIVSNPYLDPPTHASPTAVHKSHTSPAWKKALAWTGVILGALVLISQIAGGAPLAGLLIGGAMILPGAWWLIHERREANGAAPMKRHWVPVTVAAIVMLFAGGAAAPTPPKEEDSKPAVTTPSTSAAPSTTVAPTTTKTTPPTTSAPPSTTRQSSSSAAPAPSSSAPPPPAPEPAPEQDSPAPAPFIAPPRDPAPAPRPAPQTSFSSCREAKAAGAAPLYAGSPGYSTSLDRDGDGVACEK